MLNNRNKSLLDSNVFDEFESFHIELNHELTPQNTEYLELFDSQQDCGDQSSGQKISENQDQEPGNWEHVDEKNQKRGSRRCGGRTRKGYSGLMGDLQETGEASCHRDSVSRPNRKPRTSKIIKKSRDVCTRKKMKLPRPQELRAQGGLGGEGETLSHEIREYYKNYDTYLSIEWLLFRKMRCFGNVFKKERTNNELEKRWSILEDYIDPESQRDSRVYQQANQTVDTCNTPTFETDKPASSQSKQDYSVLQKWIEKSIIDTPLISRKNICQMMEWKANLSEIKEKIDTQNKGKSDTVDESKTCKICFLTFTDGRQLGGHMSKRHPGRSYEYKMKMLSKMNKIGEIERRDYFRLLKEKKKYFRTREQCESKLATLNQPVDKKKAAKEPKLAGQVKVAYSADYEDSRYSAEKDEFCCATPQ